jgi:hypothetical protein
MDSSYSFSQMIFGIGEEWNQEAEPALSLGKGSSMHKVAAGGQP